jgi:hypothetical protein
MTDRFPDLPDWTFDIDEVSAGVYRGTGRDTAGRSVSATGPDPEQLIERLRRDAAGIMTRARESRGERG